MLIGCQIASPSCCVDPIRESSSPCNHSERTISCEVLQPMFVDTIIINWTTVCLQLNAKGIILNTFRRDDNIGTVWHTDWKLGEMILQKPTLICTKYEVISWALVEVISVFVWHHSGTTLYDSNGSDVYSVGLLILRFSVTSFKLFVFHLVGNPFNFFRK